MLKARHAFNDASADILGYLPSFSYSVGCERGHTCIHTSDGGLQVAEAPRGLSGECPGFSSFHPYIQATKM